MNFYYKLKRFNIKSRVCVYFCLTWHILSVISCKETYLPKLENGTTNILVVDGFINLGADSTIFKLSRTVKIDNKNTANPEAGATVIIESNTNESFMLKDELKGRYGTSTLNLSANKKYRLRIKTSKGVVYLSDFVEAKKSPPIDNIDWEIKGNGIEVSVNTHDETNRTKYYRWEFIETWVFHSKYYSSFIWTGANPDPIDQRNTTNNNVFQCWGNENSNRIILGSTAKLNSDVISKLLVTNIPSSSEKLSEKYSILVKQYALTKEAFDFFQLLKKNNESLGSIFDSQPSELTGNIHNISDPSEPVIGYVAAGSIEKLRIFIAKNEFPTSWRPVYPYQCNAPDTVLIKDLRDYFSDKNVLVLDEVTSSKGPAYTGANRQCADCTLRGTNKKPTFWQ